MNLFLIFHFHNLNLVNPFFSIRERAMCETHFLILFFSSFFFFHFYFTTLAGPSAGRDLRLAGHQALKSFVAWHSGFLHPQKEEDSCSRYPSSGLLTTCRVTCPCLICLAVRVVELPVSAIPSASALTPRSRCADLFNPACFRSRNERTNGDLDETFGIVPINAQSFPKFW